MTIKITDILFNLLEENTKEESGEKFTDYTPIVLLSEPTPTQFTLSDNKGNTLDGTVILKSEDLDKLYNKEKLNDYTFKIESKSFNSTFKISYQELADPETKAPVLVEGKPYTIIPLDSSGDNESSKDSGVGSNTNPPVPPNLKKNRNEFFTQLLKVYGGLDLKSVYGDGFLDKEESKAYSKLKSKEDKTNFLNSAKSRNESSKLIANLRKGYPSKFFTRLDKAFKEFNIKGSKSVEESYLIEEKKLDKYTRWKTVFSNKIDNKTIDKLDSNIIGFMAAVKKWSEEPITYRGKTQSYKVSYDVDAVKTYWENSYGSKKESLKLGSILNDIVLEKNILTEIKGNKKIIFKNFKVSNNAINNSMNSLGSKTGVDNDGELVPDGEDGKFKTNAGLTMDDFKETCFYLYGKDAGKMFPLLSAKFKDIPQLFGLIGRGGLEKRLDKRAEKLGISRYELQRMIKKDMNLPKFTLKFDEEFSHRDKSGVDIKIKKGEKLIFNWDKSNNIFRHRTSAKKGGVPTEIQIEMNKPLKVGTTYKEKVTKLVTSVGSTFEIKINKPISFTIESQN